MRCEECLPVLEEYVDGEMDQSTANVVRVHLAGCPRCAAIVDSLKAEQQVYSRYMREVEVTPLLWKAIRERTTTGSVSRVSGVLSTLRSLIASTMVAPRLSPLAVLLLIAVAIGATIWITSLVRSRQSGPSSEIALEEPKPAPSAAPLRSPESGPRQRKANEIAGSQSKSQSRRSVRIAKQPESTADQLVREAEQKYLAAIAILNRDVERRRKRMNPAVVARLDVAITSIDRTIADTRRALRQNPGDTLAFEYMLTAYARKVDLLRDIANY